MSVGRSILVVDDDDRFRERLAQAFRDRGLEVRTAASAHDARALAEADSPELAVLDLRMPGDSGLELLRDLLAIDPATRAVVLTGYGSIATALEAVRRGAVDYLTKPVDAEQVLAALDGAAHNRPSEVQVELPSLARVEWEHIHRALADCDGNITQAARALGMHRRSLQRKLAKYPSRR